MKAKYYTGIFTAILIAVSPALAQRDEYRNLGDDNYRNINNNYYNDHDYYFSSRINRFHRSYTTFRYYAPVFTETYWYSYQPYTWGISIYGGSGFGFGTGIAYGYPAYGYDYGYSWYPYGASSYYWDNNPFYFNSWYIPVVYNVRFGHIRSNYYYGWHGHNRWDYGYRPVYNTYNTYNYYSSGKGSSRSSNEYRTSNRGDYPASRSNSGVDYSRRGVDYSSSTRTDAGRNVTVRDKSNNGLHSGESRRNTNPAATRDQGNSSNTPANDNMHQGADNSRRATDGLNRQKNSGSSGTSVSRKPEQTGNQGTNRVNNTPSRRNTPSGGEAKAPQVRSSSGSEKDNAKSGSSSSSSTVKSTRRR